MFIHFNSVISMKEIQYVYRERDRKALIFKIYLVKMMIILAIQNIFR